MTEEIFTKVTDWQAETFIKGTVLSMLTHMAGEFPSGEIRELIEDILAGNPDKRLEWADCFILLDGMSYNDINDCVLEKMEINKLRQWGAPDKNGVVLHTK